MGRRNLGYFTLRAAADCTLISKSPAVRPVFDASFLKSAASARDFPGDVGREVAVAGRSNSGKSSAINALLGVNKLARTSKTPGRTQLINFFSLGDERRIVDLPGYGFARVPEAVRERWRSMMDEYFRSRRSLVGLIVTVDIRRELSALDADMLAYAEELELPVLVLLTKADKLSRGAAQSACLRVRRAVPGEVGLFSALKRQGITPARAKLASWLDAE